jgi:hypothetical protein
MSCLVLVKSNKTAFFLNHWMILTGFAISILATLGLQAAWVSPFVWMTLVGTGVYMAYIPFNSLLFDRLIATFKHAGNVGFLMYLVDSFGYLGSSMIMVIKQFDGMEQISWLNFYILAILVFLSLSLILMTGSFVYFQKKLKRQEREASLQLSLSNSL